jgi:hypothetical protein
MTLVYRNLFKFRIAEYAPPGRVVAVRFPDPFFPLHGQEIDVEAEKQKIIDEAPAELVNLNPGDSSVSLRIAGRWKGSLELGWGAALTPLGSTALASETPFFYPGRGSYLFPLDQGPLVRRGGLFG